MSEKKSNFVNKAIKVHGDKYDYSLVEYKNNKNKVKIICKKHGVFEQRPDSHIYQKQGCPLCVKNIKDDTRSFINKAIKVHGDKYDYSLVDYVNSNKKVKIICKKHGVFEQKANNHLRGFGCSNCRYEKLSDIQRSIKTWSKSNFVNKAIKVHGDKYDYSLVEYKSSKNKVKIKCKHHGVFEQRARDHISGCGCPKCKESKGEKKIAFFLEDNNIEFIQQKKFNKCKNRSLLPFDFYLPEYNLCIEYQGEHHYYPIKCFGGVDRFMKIKTNDNIKTKFCESNGIRLLKISYVDFSNLEKIIIGALNV